MPEMSPAELAEFERSMHRILRLYEERLQDWTRPGRELSPTQRAYAQGVVDVLQHLTSRTDAETLG